MYNLLVLNNYEKGGTLMLSERLKIARKMNKLTQEGLAKKVKTTKGTISNYENEHSSPSNEMLNDLADALEVSTDYLLGRTDDPTPDKSKVKTPEEEFDDPELNIFFKEIKGESPERLEQLMKIWKIIKSEGK
jgi:transcriptional regulator with XRE-family HTH domain